MFLTIYLIKLMMQHGQQIWCSYLSLYMIWCYYGSGAKGSNGLFKLEVGCSFILLKNLALKIIGCNANFIMEV